MKQSGSTLFEWPPCLHSPPLSERGVGDVTGSCERHEVRSGGQGDMVTDGRQMGIPEHVFLLSQHY